jgi:hypothetical protein
MKKLLPVAIGLISAVIGIFIVKWTLSDLSPALSVLLHQKMYLGPFRIIFSFIRGVVLIIFGIGLALRWDLVRKILIFIIAVSIFQDLCYLGIMSKHHIFHEGYILTIVATFLYLPLLILLDSKYSKKYFRRKGDSALLNND